MFERRPVSNLSMEQRLQLLLDERDIRDVIYRDCRAKGRCDLKLLKGCFHKDALLHYQPMFDGTIDEFLACFEEAARAAGEMIEYIAPQILIDIDGDVGRAESYVISAKTFYQKSSNGDKIMRLSGMRFLDRLERAKEGWLIVERTFIPEWGLFQEVPALTQQIGPYNVGTEPGRLMVDPASRQIDFARDETDPSYHF